MDEATRAWWNENGKEILRELSRYLVTLTWISHLDKSRSHTGDVNRDFDVQTHAATGFLVEVAGAWYVMTAGHVVSQIYESITGERVLLKAHILDEIHLETADRTGPVPFNFAEMPPIIVDDERGADYGAIRLRPYYVRQLLAQGSAAFAAETVADDGEQFEIHTLLGFPREMRDRKRWAEGQTHHVCTKLGTPLLPIEEVEEPPEGMQKELSRFYGRILSLQGPDDERPLLADINGMSGGPVIGIDQDSLEFKLVGIQSAWNEPSRIIAACPVRPFFDQLESRITALREPSADREGK